MPAFRAQSQVRFGDVDHAGIVYYPRFFIYFHEAFEDLFNAGDDPKMRYAHIIDVRRLGFPTVHIETDYQAPLRYGDGLDIELSVPEVGRSSATFRYQGYRHRDATLAVTAHITTVCVDLDAFESREIPEDIRGLFARFSP
jgi:4-hydroxybenzoyl-CoA thioesterase